LNNSKKYSVLIVEDENDLRNLYAQKIKEEGYKVLTAQSGNEALKIVDQTTVHIVISDIRMPDGDGIGIFS
jgi:two-component system, NtrC family, response regulator